MVSMTPMVRHETNADHQTTQRATQSFVVCKGLSDAAPVPTRNQIHKFKGKFVFHLCTTTTPDQLPMKLSQIRHAYTYTRAPRALLQRTQWHSHGVIPWTSR